MTAQMFVACVLLVVLTVADTLASESIYRCTAGGRTIFTDKPLEAAECASLDSPVSNTFVAPAIGPTRAQAKVERANSGGDSIATEQVKHKQRCERIEQRLDLIASKMRAGYTVKQGEKLREQKEQLEATRRIERCR